MKYTVCWGDTCLLCDENETILSALRRGGAFVSSDCGGHGRCGKCRVRVIRGAVNGGVIGSDGTVLACLATPASDMMLGLFPEPFAGRDIAAEQSLKETAAKDGLKEKIIPQEIFENTAYVQNFTPPCAKGHDAKKQSPSQEEKLGVALDLGTTTLAAQLIDLGTGRVLSHSGMPNPQRALGADVISRVQAAMQGQAQTLQQWIQNGIRTLVTQLFALANRSLVSDYTMAVSGNTVMLHLLVGADVSGLAVSPFAPAFLHAQTFSGAQLGLTAKSVQLLPCISAFLGADVTAGLAVSDLSAADPSLLVDLGTNGEMVLRMGERLIGLSAAAGPALEGAEISCGKSGERGAVYRVDYTQGVDLGQSDVSRLAKLAANEAVFETQTIGGVTANGLCGSGLIDAAAALLQAGLMDKTGLLVSPLSKTGVLLFDGVRLTQADVRKFQLAKGAIAAGIRVLCRHADILESDIQKVVLSGGLGFYAREESVLQTGLLPRSFAGKIVSGGNTSLLGAAAYLTGGSVAQDRYASIAAKCKTLEPAEDPLFSAEFVESLGF